MHAMFLFCIRSSYLMNSFTKQLLSFVLFSYLLSLQILQESIQDGKSSNDGKDDPLRDGFLFQFQRTFRMKANEQCLEPVRQNRKVPAKGQHACKALDRAQIRNDSQVKLRHVFHKVDDSTHT
jgi:hypothetical protein